MRFPQHMGKGKPQEEAAEQQNTKELWTIVELLDVSVYLEGKRCPLE